MDRVIELEVWSQPEVILTADAGHEFTAGFPKTALPKGAVLLGLSSVPDRVDSENLKVGLTEGELKVSDFKEFCRKRGFQFDLDDVEAASAFLEFSYGRKMAWLHIPEHAFDCAELAHMVAALRRIGFVLVDPDAISCFL
ncbi:MAG TPA: hypothetical protein VFM34_06945 [Moraxellaceae bacterium]|nr:hypothetical protein [Moraxellaceae bacterium]